ncbi:hypothetical protein VTO73DRAFT_11831 [Trametes versicolor]
MPRARKHRKCTARSLASRKGATINQYARLCFSPPYLPAVIRLRYTAGVAAGRSKHTPKSASAASGSA